MNIMLMVVVGVIGVVVGALLMRVLANKAMADLSKSLAERDAELLVERNARESDRESASRMLHEKEQNCSRLLDERDRACEKIIAEKDAAIKKLLESKDREFAEMVKTLEAKFANLAAVTLEAKTKDLTAANRTSLDAAIKPLADQMVKFQDATQKAQNDNHAFGMSIHKDIEAIGGYAKGLSEFAVAIKSGNTVQGRSGEDILAEKLRQSGLEEGVTFFLQSGNGADRPDAQVCDAENRWLIIDSKVSLTAFVDYMNPNLDDATRKARLKAHVESVKGRVKSLRDKAYPKVFAAEHPDRNYLPVAAMFVPYESALNAALEAEPSLWQFALEGNVVFVTPMTLIAYLRLVQLAWQHADIEKKYDDVVKCSNELLTRMNNFVLDFQKIGDALTAAQTAYANADKVIVDGPSRQTIGNSMRKLVAAGAELQNQKQMVALVSNEGSNDGQGDESETVGDHGGDPFEGYVAGGDCPEVALRARVPVPRV